MNETVFVLTVSRFNGDFYVPTIVGVFPSYELADEAVTSMKDLNCNTFAKFHIDTTRLYPEGI